MGEIKKLTKENKQLKIHKKLIAQEVLKQREDIKKVSMEKERFREALLKIKDSFYQTNVFSQLKEAASKKEADEDKSNVSTNVGSVKNEETGQGKEE